MYTGHVYTYILAIKPAKQALAFTIRHHVWWYVEVEM